MKLLSDEGVERQIVERFQAAGHTVLYVAEMDPGLPDDDVLHAANQAGAVLVTNEPKQTSRPKAASKKEGS